MTSATKIAISLTMLILFHPDLVRATNSTEATENMSTQDQTLTGLSPEQATTRYGPALETDQFNLAPELPEFRTDLPGLFDDDAIRSGKAIRELTWSLSDTQNRTIWFAQDDTGWRYVHHKDWDKGEDF